MWKTKPVSHISTPPTTTDKGQKRRYTNIPLGTKKRSGHFDLQGWPMPEPPLQSQPPELALHPRLLYFQVSYLRQYAGLDEFLVSNSSARVRM